LTFFDYVYAILTVFTDCQSHFFVSIENGLMASQNVWNSRPRKNFFIIIFF